MFLLLEVNHVSAARPGANLEPALLLVEGEPGAVDLAGGRHQVRWDPGDLSTACQNHLESGEGMFLRLTFSSPSRRSDFFDTRLKNSMSGSQMSFMFSRTSRIPFA